MAKEKAIDAVKDATTSVVDVLTPFSKEERTRVLRAALAILGDGQPKDLDTSHEMGAADQSSVPNTRLPRARAWMKQNGITNDEIQQVFHITKDDGAQIIAGIPGRNKKEQTYNAYILTGVGQMLTTDSPYFLDKAARAVCEASGCYDIANHSAILKGRGSQFTGTKDKGWTITAPGLKRGAELIKELTKQKHD